MNPSDFLRNLPSVDELLDYPQVQSITERLNRSVVATRVRGYLDTLADQARKRLDAATDATPDGWPATLRDLVDRVSQHITHGDRWRVGAVINATGRFRGGPWRSAPLADAAIERLMLGARDFTATATSTDVSDTARVLRETTAAAGAAVFASRAGAMRLALMSLPEGGVVIVARSDLRTVEPGCRVTDLLAGLPLEVREVGAAEGATLDDFAAAIDEQAAAVLRVAPDEHPNGVAAPRAAVDDLATLAHQHNAVLIEDLASAPLLPIRTKDDSPRAVGEAAAGVAGSSVDDALRGGADLVLVRGDGLLGGPSCGVVLGDAEAIERLTRLPLAAALRVEPHIDAALAATVELLADGERFWQTSPLWSLLTTPLENLRTRAERLTPQIEASSEVAEATIVELSAADAAPSGLPIRLPTVAIALTPAEGASVDSLIERVRSGPTPMFGEAVEGRLRLDLRTVMPRQDHELASLTAGLVG